MTGINASKIIQNLEVLYNWPRYFLCPISLALSFCFSASLFFLISDLENGTKLLPLEGRWQRGVQSTLVPSGLRFCPELHIRIIRKSGASTIFDPRLGPNPQNWISVLATGSLDFGTGGSKPYGSLERIFKGH
jgi:hypothetical protein